MNDSSPVEPMFTVDEVARMLKISRWSVIRKFEHEPGVIIVLGSTETTKRARRYKVLRIPQSVINRVINRGRVR